MSTLIETLLADRDVLPPLSPKQPWRADLRDAIDSLDQQPLMAKAALHLLNDDIEKAHDLAGAHEGLGTSNLIHAALHRREGDYWNSKYWIARVPVAQLKAVYGGGRSEVNAFVDAVERAESSRGRGDESAIGELHTRQWEELKAIVELSLSSS